MVLERYDLSDYLIHFVRSINLSGDDLHMSEMFPKEFGFDEELGGDVISPFFILRRIIRKSQILSTWSYRNRKPTIYGKYPAVCFTDMPLADFIKSSFNRLKRGEKISSYALIFSKKQMFDLGARPVVYGTSISCRDYFDEGGHRLLDPNLFHSKEMYRYVSFNLSRKPYPIDWTHEREWRWANYDYINYGIDEYYFESTEIDEEMEELLDKREMERIEDYGLNLDKTNLKGVGILVKNEKQAEKIVRDILWLVDSKKIDQDLYSYILLLPDVNENINKIHKKSELNKLIEDHRLNLNPYFNLSSLDIERVKGKLNKLFNKYQNISFPKITQREGTGISFPCLRSNRNKISRILVKLNYIKFTKWGRYLVNLPICNQFNDLKLNEHLAKQIAEDLSEIFRVEFTYYSVLKHGVRNINEIDINDVPFYTEPNDIECNFAHEKKDF